MTSGSFLAAVIIIFTLVTASTTIVYASSSNIETTDSKSSSSILPSSSSHSKPANITTQVSKSNSSADYMTGNKAGKIDGSVGIRDAGAACANLNGTRLNQCIQGYNTGFNSLCVTTKFGCNE
jgi:hypothetical protein